MYFKCYLEENKLEWVDLPRELPEIRWLNLADNKLKEVDLTKIKSQRLKLLNLCTLSRVTQSETVLKC